MWLPHERFSLADSGPLASVDQPIRILSASLYAPGRNNGSSAQNRSQFWIGA